MNTQNGDADFGHCVLDFSGVKFAVPSRVESRSAIEALDFSAMIEKICTDAPGRSIVWEREAASSAVQVYKNWLWIVRKYGDGGQHIVPSIEIDEVWHCHILDTLRYRDDCFRIFGQFLHHDPYTDARAAPENKNIKSDFDVTNLIYQKEFGNFIPSFLIEAEL